MGKSMVPEKEIISISRRQFLKFSLILFGGFWIGEIPLFGHSDLRKTGSSKTKAEMHMGPLGNPRYGCSIHPEEPPDFKMIG